MRRYVDVWDRTTRSCWTNRSSRGTMAGMIDLNALRIFEKVASMRSFSAAARALGLPKSSVSRAVSELEANLGTRLLQRTTRAVVLTDSGAALRDRCGDILTRVDETVDYVGSLGGTPRGRLRISAGIGFGINVLSELLPEFITRYPEVDVSLDLSSQPVDLVSSGVDVAIRMGPLSDSEVVAKRLGTLHRYLCVAPSYVARKGAPRTIAEVCDHDAIEMPGADGRPRRWVFARPHEESKSVEPSLRISVNEALTIYRLVLNGAGIGIVSGYLCGPDIEAGRLFRLFPEWQIPSVDVSVLFPSNRELSPVVRAFVDFIKKASRPGVAWQTDLLTEVPKVALSVGPRD
jgi:LysR family transcriptional regulator for bpeEF and oprC